MHISRLRIRNFRNFRAACFTFEKGVNTLIGENGSGKTNALYALRLLIDDSLSRNAGQLRESDFCRALGDWRGHWIVLSVDFHELDPSEGCQLIRHEAAHMDGTQTGNYTLLFRPKREVRAQLFRMSNEDSPDEEIRAYLGTINLDLYETVMTGRGTGDFLDDDTYRGIVGDFDDLTFPNPDDDDHGISGVRVQHLIHGEVSCTFAQALRDVVSDLRGSRYNPVLALLRGSESSIEIEDADRIVGAVAALNTQISGLPEVRRIATGVQHTLHETVGHSYSPSVSVESALPDSIERLVQRLAVKVGDDPAVSYKGDLSEQSLGGANLIYIALKLLEYEYKRSTERVAHFLLIEEPEAHIHTHIQKTLFERQSVRRTQVIVSTHSTHISSAARIRSVNVLVRSRDHADVYQPSAGLSDQQVSRVERYLDAVRSTLLFAKGVVLVEGEAELVILPALLNAVLGVKPDELGISVVSMDAAFFEHLAVLFDEKRIRRPCAIVTDSDAALMPLPDDPAEDTPAETRARRSARIGASRRTQLERLASENPWVRAFFADHTFEVDFAAAGNDDELMAVVDDVYKTNDRREQAKQEIVAQDLETAGSRALRMADRVGKGWFALLLAEELKVTTEIPVYLVQAVAFAGGELTATVFKRMILYRLSAGGIDPDDADGLPSVTDLEALPASQVVELFEVAVPDDVCVSLRAYCHEYADR